MKLKINKSVGLIFILVFGGIAVFLLIMFFKTDSKELTDEGDFSLKWLYFIMSAGFIVIPLLTILANYMWVYSANKKENYFINYGMPGIATIVSCHSTGSELNNLQQIEMTLEIESPENKPYSIIYREYMDPITVAKLFSGLKLTILIDPKNKNKIILRGQY